MIAAGICFTAATLAYLLGSIPFGFLLVLVFRKEDIRTLGSGNIGATNVVRSGAKGLGALTFALDAAKGYVAVFAAGWLLGEWFSGPDVHAIAAISAMLNNSGENAVSAKRPLAFCSAISTVTGPAKAR